MRQIGRDYRNLFAAAAIRLVFEEDEKQVRDLTTEVAVVGGGPAGLTAAIALASAGVETVLIAKSRSALDHRTTALLASSVRALDTLGVWDQCREHAAPLRVLRIVDDTVRLLRSPEVRFVAGEIGLDAFGCNIENRFLTAGLAARADALGVLTRLAIGAEGRRSLCRAAAGIEARSRTYRQTALTFNLGHSRPHHDASTEFHTETGPFTLVPLPGQRSSLVFVVDPGDVPRLSTLADLEMAAEIERRSHSILGKITVEPGRGLFQLGVQTAARLGAGRVVLIGEAAHVIPPIGAQGLNLGLRDAATIGELVVSAHRTGDDVGGVAARYEHMRRADVTSRALAVDLLNRSLLSDFLPLQGARGFGLFLMKRMGPLRRVIMSEGVAPAASMPRLMRGEALS